jgi:alkylation response protein AidB-like acyl-CoA dehydrogenase
MSAVGYLQRHMQLGEDDAQFKASVERMLEREYGFERHRAISEKEGGIDRKLWKTMAELGWFAACLPENAGGISTSANGALILLEQCGKHLVVEPVIGGFLAPAAVVVGADADAAEQMLAGLVAGEEVWALAWCEPERRFEAEPKAVSAVREGTDWCLSGRKIVVQAAPIAEKIIVSAATSEGPTLFVLTKESLAGLSSFRTIDGQNAGEFDLEGVLVPATAVLGKSGQAMQALQRGLDWAAAGACAEAVGSMQAALDLTIAYDQTRKQFGQTLASFQVVQHRLAAMAIEVEYARSLLPFLAMHLSGDGPKRSAAVSAAHWKILSAARKVAFDAVQLHGGIGVTHEAEISHHFRRITALGLAWGSTSFHLDRYRRSRQPSSDLLALVSR